MTGAARSAPGDFATTALDVPADVPNPHDFQDPEQARIWAAETAERRPWRRVFFEVFAEALNAEPGPLSVAELGSGPGHLAAFLLARCNIATYAGIDFSAAMHEIAGECLGSLAARARFLTRDFRFPDWSDGLGAVDAVVTMQSVHEVRHKRRQPALFAEVYATLRPGGLFLFCDPYAEKGNGKNPELYLGRAEQFERLTAAGFGDLQLLLDENGLALISARRP